MTYRILITGSRAWTCERTIRNAIALAGRCADVHPQQVTVVHGTARGADTIAARVAREFGCTVEAHPADWSTGRAAGYRRNAAMVALGADMCLAFLRGPSRGTRHTIELARAAGIPVVVHDGDTTTTEET